MTGPAHRRMAGGTESGFTLIELLVVVAVIGIIAAIAIPSLMKARVNADESAAISTLRAINSAQSTYATSAGKGGYAILLSTLATPCPNNSNAFLGGDLATDPSMKSGYRIVMQTAAGSVAGPLDCNGTETRTDFYTVAAPLDSGVTGHRAFATTARGTIYEDPSGTPPTEAAINGGTATPIH